MYQLGIISAVRKDLKKLDRPVRRAVQDEHLPRIQADPQVGEPLQYSFTGLWSYPFSHQGAGYRIIYEVDQEQRLVVLLLIGSRERLYQQLRRRVGS